MALVNFTPEELLREVETIPYDENTAGVRLLKAGKAGFDMALVGAEAQVAAGATFRLAGDDSAGPAVTNPLMGVLDSDFSRELGKVALRLPEGEDLVIDHVGAFQISGFFQVVFIAKPGA